MDFAQGVPSACGVLLQSAVGFGLSFEAASSCPPGGHLGQGADLWVQSTSACAPHCRFGRLCTGQRPCPPVTSPTAWYWRVGCSLCVLGTGSEAGKHLPVVTLNPRREAPWRAGEEARWTGVLRPREGADGPMRSRHGGLLSFLPVAGLAPGSRCSGPKRGFGSLAGQAGVALSGKEAHGRYHELSQPLSALLPPTSVSLSECLQLGTHQPISA